MSFRFGHDQLCGLINTVVRTVPIDHDAVNAPADHVDDLIVNLCRIGRTVADVHVIRSPEPQEQMSIDLCIRARVKQ